MKAARDAEMRLAVGERNTRARISLVQTQSLVSTLRRSISLPAISRHWCRLSSSFFLSLPRIPTGYSE